LKPLYDPQSKTLPLASKTMILSDRRGLPITTASDRAAELYCEGVDLLLSAWPGAGETLDAAIAADPGFALAYAARARLHAIRAEGAQARAVIERSGELVAGNGTSRERSHVATLASAVTGQTGEALKRALAHCEEWPRDFLIMSLPLGAFN
jgi:hypothetical protein